MGLKDFKSSQGTVNFLRVINKIFDILNRSLDARSFKKALCQKNRVQPVQFVEDAINYISKLKLANQELVIKSKEKWLPWINSFSKKCHGII